MYSIQAQRRGAVAALGVPHMAAEDTPLHGYTIPKGATILPNIWRVLNSKDHWEDPDAFKPETLSLGGTETNQEGGTYHL